MTRILYIDHYIPLHLLVKEFLKGKNYQIEFASERVDGINQAQLKKPDLTYDDE